MVSATRCTFQTTNLWSHCSNLVQVVCLSALSRRLSHYGVRHSRSSSENTSTHTVKSADVPRWNHEHAETATSQGDECWQSYSRSVRWQRRKLRIETVKKYLLSSVNFFFRRSRDFSRLITKPFVIGCCSNSRAQLRTNQKVPGSLHSFVIRAKFFRSRPLVSCRKIELTKKGVLLFTISVWTDKQVK